MHNHQGVKASWSKQILEGIGKIKYDLEVVEVKKLDIYEGMKFSTEKERENYM